MSILKKSRLPIIFTLILLGIVNQLEAKNYLQIPIAETFLKYHNLGVNVDTLNFPYFQDAIKILEDGKVLAGIVEINNHFLSNSSEMVSSISDSLITAHKGKLIDYEIIELINDDGTKNKVILIWQTIDSERKIVFEYSAEIGESETDLVDIDNRRNSWIDLCNKNDARNLINNLYSENTIYFNHKPLIQGRESLIEEYQYMNNESYELSLEPIIVDLINEELVFEIGQCHGSYNGKYIIVWKKAKDDKWKVFIDSNI